MTPWWPESVSISRRPPLLLHQRGSRPGRSRDSPLRQSAGAADIRPFFADPTKHAVAHNATYDIRMLYRMGVDVHCRVTCTLILTHRLDENLRSFGSSETFHYHLPKVTYGLKQLTQVFFNQKPPSLQDVIGLKNTLNAPVHMVAEYCCQDTVNTFNLFERAEHVLGVRLYDEQSGGRRAAQNPVARLLVTIDDPNNVVLAKMMWEGIQIDREEVTRQRSIYQDSVQACREEIWNTLKSAGRSIRQEQLSRVLRHLKLGDDLPFDPFMPHPDHR